MEYVKLISEYVIDRNPPQSAVINGVPTGNLWAHPALLANLGYLPLTMSNCPDDGNTYRAKYAVEDGKIVQSWEAYTPEATVTSYSTCKIVTWLVENGLRAAFFSALTDDQKAIFDAATVLDSDSELFTAAIAGVQTALGLTDEQVATMLEACVA